MCYNSAPMLRRALALAIVLTIVLPLAGSVIEAVSCAEACDDGAADACAPFCAACTLCTHAKSGIVAQAALAGPMRETLDVVDDSARFTPSAYPTEIFHVPLRG